MGSLTFPTPPGETWGPAPHMPPFIKEKPEPWIWKPLHVTTGHVQGRPDMLHWGQLRLALWHSELPWPWLTSFLLYISVMVVSPTPTPVTPRTFPANSGEDLLVAWACLPPPTSLVDLFGYLSKCSHLALIVVLRETFELSLMSNSNSRKTQNGQLIPRSNPKLADIFPRAWGSWSRRELLCDQNTELVTSKTPVSQSSKSSSTRH
jgi:hypothetical protein